MKRTRAIVAIGILLLSTPALAQEAVHDMKNMGSMTPPKSAAAAAFAEVNATMHKNMSNYTGDPDADFMTGMAAHHQGALDMAKVELKYGKDPVARKLADEIVAAQGKEIDFIKGWLSERSQ